MKKVTILFAMLTDPQDQLQYLRLAASNYLSCLQLGSAHDTTVYRLCSLWFNCENDGGVNESIMSKLDHIPSHKWINIIYQLSARS